MDREESLGKRLLKYLGWYENLADHRKFGQNFAADHVLIEVPTDATFCTNKALLVWKCWRHLIFGSDGEREVPLIIDRYLSMPQNVSIVKCVTPKPPLEYSSLDELELQLSVRGF